MTEYKQLSENLFVRPQVEPAEMADLAARGFKGIINARPDDEEPGQPKSADLAAEAKRHGLAYWHIPVVPGEADQTDGKNFADALQQCPGPVVGFCKSGARATKLWELANSSSQPS
jgi:uncharacterized protein (TIGR01244 family)